MLFLLKLIMSKTKDYIIFGASFPKNVLSKIDRDRGPIPRSRYLLKLIEIAYERDEITLQEQFT